MVGLKKLKFNINIMIEKKIYILIDYKGYFESKYTAIPYNSGMDKSILTSNFNKLGYSVEFIYFSNIITYPIEYWKNKVIIYTSSEDVGLFYKDFIEDIILYLESNGAKVIPRFEILRANNNKVFMELLIKQYCLKIINKRETYVFGCLEEAQRFKNEMHFPVVYKQSAGAMSKGVGLILNQYKFKRKLFNISRSKNWFKEIWEIGRSFKYNGYIKESKNRKKFIVQSFISNLDGDYKILIYSNKFYVLKREPKKNDFKASGSGIRFFPHELPDGLLSFSLDVFNKINVPNISLDIAYDGKYFYLIELQGLYFGTYTIIFSEFYWEYDKINKTFKKINKKSILEEVYCNSISDFVGKI